MLIHCAPLERPVAHRRVRLVHVGAGADEEAGFHEVWDSFEPADGIEILVIQWSWKTSRPYPQSESLRPRFHSRRNGFSPRSWRHRLGFAQGITLSTPSLAVEEEGSIQLSAEMSFDDGSSVSIASSDLAWSIESGPIVEVSPTGLASAAAIHQDSPATIRATSGGLSGDLNPTVLDTHPDNYDTYASDGLPDAWRSDRGYKNCLETGDHGAEPDAGGVES